jgi:outer membrane receptor for ferrienterochelin and colicins
MRTGRIDCGLWLLGLTLVALTGTGAVAETAPAAGDATDYTGFSLDQLTTMDVVYGAASYDQKISDAPASVTVITAEEIQAHGYRTLADVLASVRGFLLSYDHSYDYIGVRGFGRPGDYNTRVLILLDGHPVNDIIYGSAAAGADLMVDLALIERLEVIRGPGSALYGASAFFAVVNMVTYDGNTLGGTEVAAEYGSRARAGALATWGTGFGGGGSLLLSASGFHDDGDDIHWAEYDDPATNAGWFRSGDGEDAGHAYAKFRQGELKAVAAWSQRVKHMPTGEWGMIFNDTGAWQSDERLALNLAWEHGLSESSMLRARLSWDDYRFTGDYPYDVAEPGDPLDRVVQHDSAHGRWWSGELQWAGRHGRHRLVAGADFRHATSAEQTSMMVESQEVLLATTSPYDNTSAYLQDEWSLANGVSLYAGLRYDNYRSFGSNLTPRCGLVTHPNARTTAKLLYGGAFRAPNVYELYYGDGVSQKANPHLDPERIRTWEAVIERELGEHVRAGLSAFHSTITGLVEERVDPADSLLVFANLGDARTWGVEAEVDARLLPGLRGRLGASLQDTEDRATGATLSNAPLRVLALGLYTPRQGRRLAGAGELRCVSSRRTLDDATAAAYAIVNLDLTWFTPARGLQVDLAVDNALDASYGDPGAEQQEQDVLPRAGRLFLARLTWRR